MVFRFIKIYLVLTALIVAALSSVFIYANLEHNPQGVFCDYNVEPHWTNYVNSSDEQCRIRVGIVAVYFSLPFLIGTVALHSPVYLYFLVRYLRRRRYMSSLRRRHETRS